LSLSIESSRTSIPDTELTRACIANAQEKKDEAQYTLAPSSCHFLKINRASSGVITILPPSLVSLLPQIAEMSRRLDNPMRYRGRMKSKRAPATTPAEKYSAIGVIAVPK
jgi:hypothetical protein